MEPERLRMRRCVRRWVRSWAPGSIALEVGGGTSFLKPVVKAEVPMVTFISGENAPTNQTDVVMDATVLPIATAAVDAELALEVLEHLDSPKRLLDEASRVLRPGGHLVITVPFMFGVEDFRDYYRYTPLGFSTMHASAGRVDRHPTSRGTFVASTGLIRNLIPNTFVGEPKDWRAPGRRKKVLWLLATAVLTPRTVVTWAAYGMDSLLDRDSKSPPGYFFLCTRLSGEM